MISIIPPPPNSSPQFVCQRKSTNKKIDKHQPIGTENTSDDFVMPQAPLLVPTTLHVVRGITKSFEHEPLRNTRRGGAANHTPRSPNLPSATAAEPPAAPRRNSAAPRLGKCLPSPACCFLLLLHTRIGCAHARRDAHPPIASPTVGGPRWPKASAWDAPRPQRLREDAGRTPPPHAAGHQIPRIERPPVHRRYPDPKAMERPA